MRSNIRSGGSGSLVPSCPRIVVTSRPADQAVDFVAEGGDRGDGKPYVSGRMTIVRDSGEIRSPRRDAYQVGWISVKDERKRCRIGTRLYEAAARYACAEGLTLRSDVLRSASSQGFWEKQLTKGRAICEGETERPPANSSPDIPIKGRGGCTTYRIESCTVIDLSGRKRR